VTQTTGNGPLRDRTPSELHGSGWLDRTARWQDRTAGLQVPAALTRLMRVRWVPELTLALLSALVFAFRVDRPSPWWDEAITRDVTSRSTSQILDLSAHIDLVHTAYYLLVHALLGPSDSVTPIRLLSVVAASATAVVLVRLGRQLDSLQVGVVAAMLWTIAPLSTRYAQEARPYAMVALAATLSTLALVRVCRRPWLPSRWALYSASLVLLGLLNVLSLLMVSVHLCYVLTTSSWRVRRRWCLACAAALVVLSPLLYGAATQREQVSWLPVPAFDRLTGFLLAQYATGALVIALLIVAIVGLNNGTHRAALGLGLAWALIPPVLLWTISQVHPLYDWRYVFFTVPGGALALASLMPLIRARLMIIAIVVLAIAGLHMQDVYRYLASGHGENLRGVAEAVRTQGEDGDAVLFLPGSRRVVKLAYPEAFRSVDDIALARTGEQSATLMGTEEPTSEIAKELKRRNRVWLITGSARFGEVPVAAEQAKEQLLYDRFRLAGVALKGRYEVRLYVRARTNPSAGIQRGTAQQLL
jgi:mannosyltransferase